MKHRTLRTARFYRRFIICSASNDLFGISMKFHSTMTVVSSGKNPRNRRCNYQQLLFTHIPPHNLHTAGSSFNCIRRVYTLWSEYGAKDRHGQHSHGGLYSTSSRAKGASRSFSALPYGMIHPGYSGRSAEASQGIKYCLTSITFHMTV